MAPRSDASRKLTRAFRRVHIVHMAACLLPGPFTVDSYRRLAELGILHQDDRVELVAGQVLEMTPIGDRHASCVRRLINLFAPNLRDVADTSLSYDREIKIPRYAAAGIPEAWLVDLVGDAVSVCRRPGSNGYGEIVTVTRGGTLRPLLLPGVAVGVDDILG